MMAPMRRLFLELLTLSVGIAGLTGCRAVHRGMTERILGRGKPQGGRMHYGASGKRYTLDDKGLKDVAFEGSFTSGGTVRVDYPKGLYRQAESLADMTADLVGRVQERLGVTIRTKCHMYLLRVDEIPQNAEVDIAVEPNEFPMPLFVKVGDESAQAILAQNRTYPYVLLHELVETSVTRGLGGGPVLPDVQGGMAGLRGTLNNYTRWFREGLANYAGYVACAITATRLVGRQGHTHPFSALHAIRGRLFSWSQYARTPQEGDCYSAALGVFLLIREEFGEQAIRDIVAEVARRQSVDGRDLIDIVNHVIGGDIEARVTAFTFPRVDAELAPVTAALALNEELDVTQGLFVESVEPNGWAARAGLKEKDVMTAVHSAACNDPLDFELSLFRTRTLPSVSLTVHRRDAGVLTLVFPTCH
jgi:hypothetical protein